MYAMTTNAVSVRCKKPAAAWAQALLVSAFWVAVVYFLLPSLAHATNSSAAQTRINAVAAGWQTIVTGVGVAVLVIAWSYVGYQIAFAGKTMKDMFATMMGSSIAGLAPMLVTWLFN